MIYFPSKNKKDECPHCGTGYIIFVIIDDIAYAAKATYCFKCGKEVNLNSK